MKLLLDANLSWRLIKKLSSFFTKVEHVDSIGFQVPAQDIEIWQYAKQNNCLIVTNDEGFMRLLQFNGFPPKIILLRTGNQSNDFIANLLIEKKTDIEAFLKSDNYGLLEVY